MAIASIYTTSYIVIPISSILETDMSIKIVSFGVEKCIPD